MASSHQHPCQRCGACCAHFRVAFYWREAEPTHQPRAVPLQLVEDCSPFLRCMSGTNQKHQNRCVSLEGKVGQQVGCAIYANRPSPCRLFAASYENGVRNSRCEAARAHHGLPPLRRQDWEKEPCRTPADT